MSDQYAGISGFVQFDTAGTTERPNPKDVNGQSVFEFMLRGVGFQGQPLVKVSLWPQFAAVHGKINKGDFVAVDGKFSSYTSEAGKTYYSINAKHLVVNGQLIEPADDGGPRVTNPTAAAGASALPF